MRLIGSEFANSEFQKMKFIVTEYKKSLTKQTHDAVYRKYEWWTNSSYPFKYAALPQFFITSTQYSIHILEPSDEVNPKDWKLVFKMMDRKDQLHNAPEQDFQPIDGPIKTTIIYNRKETDIHKLSFKFIKTAW